MTLETSHPPTEPQATFYGGIWAGLVPLGVFLTLVLGLVFLGAPTTEGMIVAAMIGVTAGMFFARDYGVYCERVFSLMANRVATVAIVCWLWAGAFSGILGMSGLVEAVVWLGWSLGLEGSAFVVVTFVCSAAFAVCVGTGLGTVIGFTAVMYPAGIVLSADPAVVLGAIVSGAAFGDNLAPISDTTIVSAATQETDVAGVVKSRLKYVLPCAAISAVCFLFVGGGDSVGAFDADKIIAETANSKGLPMLLPPLLVFIVAVAGYHFLAALAVGIFSACVIGVLFGIFPVSELFSIGEGGTTEGALISGAMGLVPTAILTLLLVTAIGILNESGFVEAMMKWLDRTIAKTLRGRGRDHHPYLANESGGFRKHGRDDHGWSAGERVAQASRHSSLSFGEPDGYGLLFVPVHSPLFSGHPGGDRNPATGHGEVRLRFSGCLGAVCTLCFLQCCPVPVHAAFDHYRLW